MKQFNCIVLFDRGLKGWLEQSESSLNVLPFDTNQNPVRIEGLIVSKVNRIP